MKKLLIFILSFLCILNVNAATIKDRYITGPKETKMGETITVNFNIEFDGINKDSMDTEGIWLVGFDLKYDTNFYSIASIESPGWMSGIYEENGEYAVMSFPDENYSNKCLDGYLNCGNYNAKISFYVKDTDLSASAIVMGETYVGLFKLKENPDEYSTEDLIELTDKTLKDIQVLIKEDKEVKIEEPPSIIQEEPPKLEEIDIVTPITTKKITTKKVTTTTTTKKEEKSKDNVYLKSLEIEGYKIKFKKYYADYIIYIEDEVNELNITAIPDDENATVNIIGADNLKENEYKVKIEVTSPNEEKRVYTIKARFKEENKFLNKLKETIIDNKTLLIVSGGAILLLIVLIIILKSSYNRKLDKALNRL